MKNFGKAFLVSIVFLVTAGVLLGLQLPLYSAMACVIAFFANVTEIKGYATYYQFINFRVVTLALGYSLDVLLGEGTYWYTLCMFVMSFTGTFRLEMFNVFLFDKHLWMEAVALLGTYGLYVYANLQHPGAWEGWALPILPILFMTYIGTSIVTTRAKYASGPRPAATEKAELGNKAPHFSLPDVNGNEISLSDFENRNHLLLIFVRGDWCPSCHIMIREYEKNRERFVAKNIVPIGISPDSNEVNRAMMERLGWQSVLLSDARQEVATKYGLLFADNNAETKYEVGVALPASFLVDKNGVLRYMSRSDRAGEFLSPSLIFPVIDQLN